jgi:hypothetical protein
MPVSNPSYFPDIKGNGSIIGITAGRNATGANDFLAGNNAGANSTVNDLIVIGNNSGAAGITDANLSGSIIIGVGSAPFITASAGSAVPLTLIGENNLALINQDGTTRIDSTVVIGSGIMNGGTGNGAQIAGNVLVGNLLFPTTEQTSPTSTQNSVVIGYRIGLSVGGVNALPQNAVMIGAVQFVDTANFPYSGMYIGVNIDCTGSTGAAMGPNVVIGNDVIMAGGATSCVIIGDNTVYQGLTAAASIDNVCVGTGVKYNGNSNVVIGPNAQAPNPSTVGPGFGNVIIGSYAGTTVPDVADLNNLLLIESSSATSGVTPAALLYGFFSGPNAGAVILGNSVQAVSRDVQGTNTVKLLNGTIGSADPVGGGYFYVLAGALHWVGSSGTDSVVAPA